MNARVFLCICCAIALGGCYSSPSASPTDTPGGLTATAPPLATATAPAPTASRTPQSTLTPSIPAPMAGTRWRIEVAAVPIETHQLIGNLIFTGPGRFRHFLYHTNLQTMTDLPGSYVELPENAALLVSPDRMSFAYTGLASSLSTRVWVVGSDLEGDLDALLPGTERYDLVGWADNGLLILIRRSLNDGTLFSLDPHGSALKEIRPSFPSVTDKGSLVREGTRWEGVYYSTDLSHVVVPRFSQTKMDSDPPVPGSTFFEMWGAAPPPFFGVR